MNSDNPDDPGKEMTIRLLSLLLIFLFTICPAAEIATLRFQKAQDLVQQGKLEEALQEYRAILLDNPKNAQAYYEAGQVRSLQGKWNAAIQNYGLGLKHDPHLAGAQEAIAEAYENLGQREKAIIAWRKVADNESAEAKSKATSHIESLLHNAPISTSKVQTGTQASTSRWHYDSPEFIQGLANYQAGKWHPSLEYWRKVLSSEPGNPGAFYYAGVCRFNLKQYDKAEYNLLKSLPYPDKGFNAHYYLGRIYEIRQNAAKARHEYQAYLGQNPSPEGRKEVEGRLAALPDVSTSPQSSHVIPSSSSETDSVSTPPPKPLPEKIISLEIGIFFTIGEEEGPGAAALEKALQSAKVKDYSKTIESLKQLRLDYPGTPNALAAGYNLSALYDYLGLPENLRVLVSTLLREDAPEPYRSALRTFLSKALKDVDELRAARSVLDSVKSDLALGPTVAQKSLLESQIAEMQKTEKDVPALLEKAITTEKDPLKRADMRLRLGQVWARQGMNANAEKVFHDLLESCSSYTTDQCRKALYALGDMAYHDKAWNQAADYYHKAVTTYPDSLDSPWGFYQIANTHRQKKQWNEAVAAYDSLLQKFPSSYWAEQGRWNREDVIWRGQNSQLLKKGE